MASMMRGREDMASMMKERGDIMDSIMRGRGDIASMMRGRACMPRGTMTRLVW